MNTNELRAMISSDIEINEQFQVWNSSSFKNYEDALDSQSTYETPSKMFMVSDLENAKSDFLDFMEVRDLMDTIGIGMDYAWGLVYKLNGDYSIYIELDIIQGCITEDEFAGSNESVVRYALDVLDDVSKHRQALPEAITQACIGTYIHPYKTQ